MNASKYIQENIDSKGNLKFSESSLKIYTNIYIYTHIFKKLRISFVKCQSEMTEEAPELFLQWVHQIYSYTWGSSSERNPETR